MTAVQQLKAVLKQLSSPEKAKNSAWFFKTGKGQYGEGDVFIGVTMPEQRNAIKPFMDMDLDEIVKLLKSPEHEYRMCALLIMVAQYKKGSKEVKENIYNNYLAHTKWINNWDLVDASAEHIVGPWLADKKDKMKVLTHLANAQSLWDRRIAMLATFHYIKKGSTEEALYLAEILLKDKEDLMHKAVGWMLREIGKRCSKDIEEMFLVQHYHTMPRTMLRYAIEHFPETQRQAYLKGLV